MNRGIQENTDNDGIEKSSPKGCFFVWLII